MIDVAQVGQMADEQCRAAQQHNGERHLRDDEAASEEAAGTRVAGASGGAGAMKRARTRTRSKLARARTERR